MAEDRQTSAEGDDYQEKARHHVHPIILARARELRQPLTPAEQKLWRYLRRKQLYGIRFRRQHPVYRFILDFFCFEHRLVIEVDGPSHAKPEQQRYDAARTEWLTRRGYRVIRFTNEEVFKQTEAVLITIARACEIEI
jgi:very-short-patch-repair endonuclease